MSVIEYYKLNDDYSSSLSAKLNEKKQQIQEQYLNQQKIIQAANLINAITDTDIDSIESNIAAQVNISDLGGSLNEELAGYEKQLYGAIKEQNSEKFSEVLKDLIKLKSGLLQNETWSLTEDDAFNLSNLTLEKLQLEGNIANQIGRAGDILAQFQMMNIAEQLITKLQLNSHFTAGIFDITMKDTGNIKARSTSGLGQKTVNIQTDSQLIVSNNGINYIINFSNKSSGKFAKNIKSKINAKLRQSSVGAFINNFGMKYEILNALSLHREQGSKNPILLSKAREQAQLTMGAFLFAALVEEEKVNQTGELLNDVINFTIVGARLVPEENILNKLFNRFNNNRLKASVEGISYNTIIKQRDECLWRNTNDAENYFLGRAITLMQSI